MTFLVSFWLSFGHQEAFARQDIVPGSRYTSGRAAALGDAFLPLAEDGAAALFYNPAAIGLIREPHAEPLNLSLHVNSHYPTFLNAQFYKVVSLSGYSPVLAGHPGQWAGVGAALAPNYSMRGFAFGILAQTQLAAVYNADGTIRYKSLYQLIPTAGTGVRLAGGILRLGYSVQWVNQSSGDLTVPGNADPMGYTQGISQGSAFSHNVGVAMTLPYAFLPQLNLVIRNILQAKFNTTSLVPLAANSSGPPPNEPTTFDASFSIQPKTGRGSLLNMVGELRDVTNRSNVSIWGRAALGLEFMFRDRFFLRGGWGSGYPSAGVGIKSKGGEFSATWYSEEIGVGYHDVRDVRYLIHYQMRIF